MKIKLWEHYCNGSKRSEKIYCESYDKEYSSLGIITELISLIQNTFDVPPESFDPPPKIMSSILYIKRYG